MTMEYTHELNREVRAISGWYELEKEGTLSLNGKKVLYALGNAALDSSCCGRWECYYAVVPGYVVHWKHRKNHQGMAVTMVEPVQGDGTKQKITKLLEQTEKVDQVLFW